MWEVCTYELRPHPHHPWAYALRTEILDTPLDVHKLQTIPKIKKLDTEQKIDQFQPIRLFRVLIIYYYVPRKMRLRRKCM